MAELRRSTRQRALLGARIIFNQGASTIDCHIRNISAEGAKILVSDQCAIPQVFEFHVPQKDQSFRARVIWRHDNEAGVEFLNMPTAHSDSPEPAARVKDLERENAMLKKQIAQLKLQIERHMEAGI